VGRALISSIGPLLLPTIDVSPPFNPTLPPSVFNRGRREPRGAAVPLPHSRLLCRHYHDDDWSDMPSGEEARHGGGEGCLAVGLFGPFCLGCSADLMDAVICMLFAVLSRRRLLRGLRSTSAFLMSQFTVESRWSKLSFPELLESAFFHAHMRRFSSPPSDFLTMCPPPHAPLGMVSPQGTGRLMSQCFICDDSSRNSSSLLA
jgi:hypothetical protein